MLDFAGMMADSQKQGWAVVCLDLGVDTTTPAGRMSESPWNFDGDPHGLTITP